MNGTCICPNNWNGDLTCSTCTTNYGPAGVCNIQCNSTTCYGHGTCQSDFSCNCFEGYDSTYNCGMCASGYSGYPSCIFNTPSISYISPLSGPTAGGTTLVLFGHNLQFITGFILNNVSCSILNVASTTLSIKTPAGIYFYNSRI